jgi:hypothetical protein
MKIKIKSVIIIIVLLASIWAFKPIYELNKATAEVSQEEGLYIFYRSKPISEYDYLGTYKIGLIWDDKPSLLFSKLVRKVKKEYPQAQAIIIDNNMGKCDAIKFK